MKGEGISPSGAKGGGGGRLPVAGGAAGDINASAASAAKERNRGHDVGRRGTSGGIAPPPAECYFPAMNCQFINL